MKKTFGIQLKLLLGIGILVAGSIASATFGHFAGLKAEQELAIIGKVNVPLTLDCQAALFAFESATKSFSDALMTGEAEGVKSADAATKAALQASYRVREHAEAAGLPPAQVSAAIATLEGLDERRAEVFKAMSAGGTARDAIRSKAETLANDSESLRRRLGELGDLAAQTLQQRLAARIAASRRQQTNNAVTALVVIIVGCAAVGWIVRRYIIRPIGAVSEGLRASSQQVANASETIRASGQKIADSSSSQAASLEETSATLEEISSGARRNAEHSALAKQKVSDVRGVAERSTGDISAMRSAMNEIQAASNSIASIVKTIDEIAFQTNILALNAAVEAARAGEAGAGFAVVADEVRNLAQRCANAARETATMIENSISKSTRGVHMSGAVAAGLEQISSQIKEVDVIVAEIADASREQSTGVTEVNRALIQLNESTQANAATAEEAAATVEELASQVEALRQCTRALNDSIHGSSGSTAVGGDDLASPPMARPLQTAVRPRSPVLVG